MNHSVGHIALEGRIFQSVPPKRPLSIAELSEKARDDGWDETKELDYHLRIARECRKAGKECATRGDIEGAFVELTRAATLALERIPSHRNYYTILDANQRHNIALNGQDILDDLSYLKPLLVDELNDWFQTYGINDQERAAFVSRHWTHNIVGQASMQAQRKHKVEERTRKKPFLAPDEMLATSSLSLPVDINYSSECTNHGHRNHMNGPTKRPSSIAELAEKAKDDVWDETKEFKQHLSVAEKYRKKGGKCLKRNDLEGAFVELSRAATLVERLPSHRDYNTMLNANQRHNLSLNGQAILDNLADLKPALVYRYEKWLQQHGADGVRTQKAINSFEVQAQQEECARQIIEKKLPRSEKLTEQQQLFLFKDGDISRYKRSVESVARWAASTVNEALPPDDPLMAQEISEFARRVDDGCEEEEEAWDIGQCNDAEYVSRSTPGYGHILPRSPSPSVYSCASSRTVSTDYGVCYTNLAPSCYSV